MLAICPGCNEKSSCSDSFLGKKVRCPVCGHVFVVSGDHKTGLYSGADDTATGIKQGPGSKAMEKKPAAVETAMPMKHDVAFTVPKKQVNVESEDIVVECSKCGVGLEFPAGSGGGVGDCPNCGNVFMLPRK